MLNEFGHFALILALPIAVLQMVIPMVGAAKGWQSWMRFGQIAAVAQFTLVLLAFAILMRAFIISDFSLLLVVENSHSLKPMLYKISGVWGNHEGSMLLWVLILTGFGATAALFGAGLPDTLRARVLAVQSSIGVAFLAFILFTSN
ncbi:MAG: heme lyase NrfEFG subunit NrfE, partial [Rhodobacteraceae bacterium]|nr:heme lyase NrfEFG subunit NrfE [Paracoccaceae bacterium]